MWTIVPQEIKERGEVTGFEDCKHVKCFPSQKPGQQVTFGRFKFPVLKVIIENEEGARRKITWSNYHNQELSSGSPGKFTYHYELSVSKSQKRWGDWEQSWEGGFFTKHPPTKTSKPRQSDGKREFESHSVFLAFLRGKFGNTVADMIMQAFTNKIAEVLTEEEEPAAAA